jgi:hypothetical protein
MSERDRELLKMAGTSVAKAASLVGRSRQAFYTGLKRVEDYLRTSDLLILLLDAKRRDAPHLAQLVEFIDARYSSDDAAIDKELLIPGRVGIRQLLRACYDARRIVMLVNENVSHLNSHSMLTTALAEILRDRGIPKIKIVVPNSEVGKKLYELLEIPTGQLSIHHRSVVDIPTVVISKRDSVRAFGFTLMSIEEFDAHDAKSLWEMADSRYSKVLPNPF